MHGKVYSSVARTYFGPPQLEFGVMRVSLAFAGSDTEDSGHAFVRPAIGGSAASPQQRDPGQDYSGPNAPKGTADGGESRSQDHHPHHHHLNHH